MCGTLDAAIQSKVQQTLREELSIRVLDDGPDDCVTVALVFRGEVISKDYIDYSEVVRVVERLNAGEYH